MRRFRDLSIRGKLTATNMLSSGMALLLACLAILAYERFVFRGTMVRTLSIEAEMVGANVTSALLFRDPTAARDMLSGLRADSHIVSAAIYDASGDFFAGYTRRGSVPVPSTPTERTQELERFDRGLLIVARALRSEGKVVGWLRIESDLEELDQRVERYTGIIVLVLLLSFLLALLISSRLQRSISEPVLSLVEAAQTVSREQDYSIRAPARSRDELGVLIDNFNRMLAQIQERDSELREARDLLEHRVEERTAELQREVGERRQAEQALARQATELSRSNADLEQFAYAASHDLQEPLRMVGNFTQLLDRRYRGQLDSEADEFIHFVVDGVRRMQSLINDLLAYSRVGRQGGPRGPADCAAILRRTLANLQTAIEEAGARVTHDPLPEVLADPSQLTQLLQNLIGNALKFHGENPPRVHLSAVRQGGDWLFSVADNGVGIDAEYLDRIFALFQRLHARDEYPGTGIGLAICKKIVERHGGKIWVESVPRSGSTFFFTIPVVAHNG